MHGCQYNRDRSTVGVGGKGVAVGLRVIVDFTVGSRVRVGEGGTRVSVGSKGVALGSTVLVYVGDGGGGGGVGRKKNHHAHKTITSKAVRRIRIFFMASSFE